MTKNIEEHEEINLHISKKLFWNICILIFGTLWFKFGLYVFEEQIKDSLNFALIPFIVSMIVILVLIKVVNLRDNPT